MLAAGRVLLDLLIPPRCAGCGRRDTWLCLDCVARLPRLPDQHCRVCAVPLADVQVCPACYRHRPPYERIAAPLLHEDLARDLVHRLKYRGQRHLAPHLAALAAPLVSTRPDLVIPVPLHATRQRERGFNQSELISRELARALGAPVAAVAVTRLRPTVSQTGLSHKEREANVRGAFAADRSRLTGARVLLVDDVCTTGATIAACARALRRAGAASVEAIVVNRARRGSPLTQP